MTEKLQSMSDLAYLIYGKFIEGCMDKGIMPICDSLPRGISREAFELAYGHTYVYKFLEGTEDPQANFSEYMLFCEMQAVINKEFGTLKFKN